MKALEHTVYHDESSKTLKLLTTLWRLGIVRLSYQTTNTQDLVGKCDIMIFHKG